MDPDANLKEQLELAESILYGGDSLETDKERLAELVLALDQWIRNHGHVPSRWRVEQ